MQERSDYSSRSDIEKLLIQFMGPIALALAEGLVPLIFTHIVKLEQYRPVFEIKFTLFRYKYRIMTIEGIFTDSITILNNKFMHI